MADYSQTKAPGVYVEQVPAGSAPIAGVGTSTAGFVGVVPDSVVMPTPRPAAVDEPKLCTNFTEFKNSFGDFSSDPGQSLLAHAVYGFFENGGTRCYVARVLPGTAGTVADIAPALAAFEPIEEIAIVAAPGLTNAAHYAALITHTSVHAKTRFAILDTDEVVNDYATALAPGLAQMPPASDTAAVYFPWIQVFDPLTKQTMMVPPSGHMAGIYARVDTQRGVFKAPANETVLGALDVKYAVSARQQDGLNPNGVNCLRKLGGAIKVWGARTVGSTAATEFKYINVRRLFNYLRGSIEQGTQWAVFEPNNPDLWAKITRNVGAFLQSVWAAGGLFGETTDQAFYVKCDAETNPPDQRDLGLVVTEIGVAITRPAEFVVFRLGQKAAG